MVVLMLEWPTMTWAMWGGRPERMASVMNTRQKSWGGEVQGLTACVGEADEVEDLSRGSPDQLAGHAG
ncbi:hypothetical protein ACWC9Q_34810 [Streptomyces sp. NPDC001142]